MSETRTTPADTNQPTASDPRSGLKDGIEKIKYELARHRGALFRISGELEEHLFADMENHFHAYPMHLWFLVLYKLSEASLKAGDAMYLFDAIPWNFPSDVPKE